MKNNCRYKQKDAVPIGLASFLCLALFVNFVVFSYKNKNSVAFLKAAKGSVQKATILQNNLVLKLFKVFRVQTF
jgi:hypothetical protein